MAASAGGGIRSSRLFSRDRVLSSNAGKNLGYLRLDDPRLESLGLILAPKASGCRHRQQAMAGGRRRRRRAAFDNNHLEFLPGMHDLIYSGHAATLDSNGS